MRNGDGGGFQAACQTFGYTQDEAVRDGEVVVGRDDARGSSQASGKPTGKVHADQVRMQHGDVMLPQRAA